MLDSAVQTHLVSASQPVFNFFKWLFIQALGKIFQQSNFWIHCMCKVNVFTHEYDIGLVALNGIGAHYDIYYIFTDAVLVSK